MALPRVHGFEWNDQPWCPRILRRSETRYLETVIRLAKGFAPLAPKIASLVDPNNPQIVDLGSGGAGPWRHLADEVAKARGGPVEVRLTDLYPDATAFARVERETGGVVRGVTEPVDARHVPRSLAGVRTMFDTLHHMRPDDARAIFEDAARSGAPIVAAEAVERSARNLIGMLFSPLFVLLVTPVIRPVSGWQLLFTYVIPIVPLIVLWDGIVSCLRSYRPEELRALVADLGDRYAWDIGTLRQRGNTITYVVGASREKMAACASPSSSSG
jgi:hypothetical protein